MIEAPTRALPPQPWPVEASSSAALVARVDGGAPHDAILATRYARNMRPQVERWFTGQIQEYPLNVERETDVFLLPRNVAVSASGQVLQRNFSPKRIGAGLLIGDDDDPNRLRLKEALKSERARVIAAPALVMDSCWAGVYGHLLLEMLPMLMLRQHVPPDAVLLTSAPPSRTLQVLAERLGFPAERVVHLEEPLFCAEAYYVDPPVRIGHSWHPLATQMFEQMRWLGASRRVPRPRRVYVSRSDVSSSRRLQEEREVEELFVRYGFTIFHPERGEIEDQIAVFSAAEMVAGPAGSGLHNIVFSHAAVPLLILKYPSFPLGVDIALSRAPRRIGYVNGVAESPEQTWSSPWSINPDDVEVGIKQHFGL